jgi:hypothetical protein
MAVEHAGEYSEYIEALCSAKLDWQQFCLVFVLCFAFIGRRVAYVFLCFVSFYWDVSLYW